MGKLIIISIFVKMCINNIRKSKPPLFCNVNKINIYTCQNYPMVLQDLIFIEKSVIAYAHLVITIIKLTPNNSSIFATYS